MRRHRNYRIPRSIVYVLQLDQSADHLVSNRGTPCATIDVRFELSIDDDKTLPLATLAEAVTDQNLEAVLLESLVESLDAASVEALCGEKHAHGSGDQRFQRAGTDTRTAVTTAGEHEFSLHYVEDTAASPDESSYFRPVEDVLDFDGQNRYQQDIAAKASISLPRSAIETLPITATASSRCRRRPPSTAVPEIRPQAQTVPSRLCRWHRR